LTDLIVGARPASAPRTRLDGPLSRFIMPEEIKQDEKPAPPKEPTNYPALAGRVATLLISCYIMWTAMKQAYFIRLFAINTYGRVIHEFDPWFNFRATQYLADHGLDRFFKWYDYMSWYPLGRPVGTTIYPGMQMSSVFIWNALSYFNRPMSLNDVCCFVPAWFGISATVFLGLLTGECTQSYVSGAAAALIMAILPAHIMRSVGGGYDNESIALTAMCCTFFCWCRALRPDPKKTNGEATRDSVIFGTLCGFSYIYMVAAWGGYVFVLNMVGVHAALLVLLGRYSSRLHRAPPARPPARRRAPARRPPADGSPTLPYPRRRVLSLLLHRHAGRGAGARRQHDAAPLARADGPTPRLRRRPGAQFIRRAIHSVQFGAQFSAQFGAIL